MSPVNRFLLKSFVVLVIGIGLYYIYSAEMEKSLWRKDCLELRAAWDRWNEAGRPQNEKLADFMRGRNPNILVSTQTFEFDGSVHQAQFELAKLSWRDGGLFVTTNRSLFWRPTNGKIEMLSKPSSDN